MRQLDRMDGSAVWQPPPKEEADGTGRTKDRGGHPHAVRSIDGSIEVAIELDGEKDNPQPTQAAAWVRTEHVRGRQTCET